MTLSLKYVESAGVLGFAECKHSTKIHKVLKYAEVFR